jgi:hypothetical protein
LHDQWGHHSSTKKGIDSNPPFPDPLDAAGGLTVNGDYEEASAATLAIDIATADSAGETHDQLEISGEAILAGQLEVNRKISKQSMRWGEVKSRFR